MIRTIFKKGQQFGKWQLEKFINAGGNGEVWKAALIDDTSEIAAIKLLKRINKEGYIRFRDEVKVLMENSDILGLLQIIDQNLPENPKGDTPWYIMPLAKPSLQYLKKKSPEQIIDAIISVSNILIKLHERGISHRDIKPANILVKDDVFYLSDFGLVEYPTKEDITIKWKDVGPRWTIAPEMRRNPDTADGKLADVYSIAKTFWIFLTKVKQGFEGQYNIGSSIEIKNFVPSIYYSPIDDLIHRCTDHDPQMRQGIRQFSNGLIKWKELNKDFEKRSKSEWKDIQKTLFPSAMPRTVIWQNVIDTITVLNIISEHGRVNHTFLPGGGGLDLEGAKLSFEEGCVELTFNEQAFIVRPTKLTFECFEGDSDWNYFRLDTEGLEIIGKHEYERIEEALTEIEPCIYSDYQCWEYDDFDGERLPDSARPVVRIAKGSFLICLRTGMYNKISGTYDGRHNKIDADEFRNYIEKGIRTIRKPKGQSSDDWGTKATQFKRPQYVESTKIRKGSRILTEDEIKLLEKAIVLFKAARKETKQIEEEVGLNGQFIDFFSEQTFEAMSRYDEAVKPCNKAFDSFLESLADDELLLVEAVMYGGRDAFGSGRAHPLDEMLTQFEKDSRDSRIYSISEKAPLDEYLQAGIEAYK